MNKKNLFLPSVLLTLLLYACNDAGSNKSGHNDSTGIITANDQSRMLDRYGCEPYGGVPVPSGNCDTPAYQDTVRAHHTIRESCYNEKLKTEVGTYFALTRKQLEFLVDTAICSRDYVIYDGKTLILQSGKLPRGTTQALSIANIKGILRIAAIQTLEVHAYLYSGATHLAYKGLDAAGTAVYFGDVTELSPPSEA